MAWRTPLRQPCNDWFQQQGARTRTSSTELAVICTWSSSFSSSGRCFPSFDAPCPFAHNTHHSRFQPYVIKIRAISRHTPHLALDANLTVGFGFQTSVRVAAGTNDQTNKVISRKVRLWDVHLLDDLAERMTPHHNVQFTNKLSQWSASAQPTRRTCQ
jgi:hypothetical protein